MTKRRRGRVEPREGVCGSCEVWVSDETDFFGAWLCLACQGRSREFWRKTYEEHAKDFNTDAMGYTLAT